MTSEHIESKCPSCNELIEFRVESVNSDTSHAHDSVTVGDCPRCGRIELDESPDATLTYIQAAGRSTGDMVAHFDLVRLLGRGAFGAVWLAVDRRLQRRVALKLPVSDSGDPDELLHEARSAAGLRHPNIVRVLEVGDADGQIFIANEFIDGINLKDALTADRPQTHDAVRQLAKIARAVDFAHQNDIIHRDIKPANVMLDSAGEPYVADFGLAKQVSDDATLSSEGQILGTAKYMSPEQALGQAHSLDARTDVYSLGVILFEMLTGEVPFRGNARAILHQKIHEDPPSPRTLQQTLPRDLETVCLRCLEKDRFKRYSSAAELADELDRFLDGKPIQARPVTALERAWRWCRRKPAVAALIAVLLVSLTTGLAGVTTFWLQAERTAATTRDSLYRSQMNLASVHLAQGNVDGVRAAVNRFRPQDGLQDIRGFEWFYFDAQTTSVQQLVNQDEAISDVATSPDGSLFATCSPKLGIRVWRSRDGSLLRELIPDSGLCQSVAFVGHNDMLASGSSDGVIRFWSPRQDDQTVRTVMHGPPVARLETSRDRTLLLSRAKSGAIRVWNLTEETPVSEIPSGPSGSAAAAFHPDGTSIAIAQKDGVIRLWQIEGPKQVQKFEEIRGLESVSFSSDGQQIYAGTYGGSLVALETSSGEQTNSLNTGLGAIGAIEPIPHMEQIAVAGVAGSLKLIDADRFEVTRRVPTHSFSFGMLDHSESARTLVVGSGDGTCKLIDLTALTSREYFWSDAPVRKLQLNNDGSIFDAVTSLGAVSRRDSRDGSGDTFEIHPSISLAAFDFRPGTNQVALAAAGPQIEIWDVESGQQVQTVTIEDRGIRSLHYSQSGQILAVAGRNGKVHFLSGDEPDGPIRVSDGMESTIISAAFSPDESKIAVIEENGQLNIIDVATAGISQSHSEVAPSPSCIDWSSNNAILIGNQRGSILIWDASRNLLHDDIRAHSGRINVIRKLPESQTVVSAGRDSVIKLWDLESSELIAVFGGHRRQVFDIAVSADGRTMASGDLEGAVRIWRTVK